MLVVAIPLKQVIQQYFCFKCDKKYEAIEGIDAICPTCGSRGKCIKNLGEFLLADKRDFIINKVKVPLISAIIRLVGLIKIKPTALNCRHPNSLVLLRMWERFFRSEANEGREPVERAISEGSIYEYEHDPYYARRLDWVLEEINKRKWLPRESGRPRGIHWREFHDYTKDT